MSAQPPAILSCAEWGAQTVHVAFSESAAQGIIIHHMASANREPLAGAAEAAKAKELARRTQKDHTAPKPQGNGWADTGQHFTVSKGGLLLEGRHGSLAAAKEGHVVRGAHANSDLYNRSWFGIEIEGNYVASLDKLPEAQWQAVIELCAWLSFWGEFQSLNIKGHLEVAGPGHTDCPGKLMSKRAELREAVHLRKLAISEGAV